MNIEIRKAGDVVGTPDWQLDRMYETETKQMLEKAYADGSDYSEQIKELEEARKSLDKVIDNLLCAEDELTGTEYEATYGSKIRDAMHGVEGIDIDVKRIINLLRGCAR